MLGKGGCHQTLDHVFMQNDQVTGRAVAPCHIQVEQLPRLNVDREYFFACFG